MSAPGAGAGAGYDVFSEAKKAASAALTAAFAAAAARAATAPDDAVALTTAFANAFVAVYRYYYAPSVLQDFSDDLIRFVKAKVVGEDNYAKVKSFFEAHARATSYPPKNPNAEPFYVLARIIFGDDDDAVTPFSQEGKFEGECMQYLTRYVLSEFSFWKDQEDRREKAEREKAKKTAFNSFLDLTGGTPTTKGKWNLAKEEILRYLSELRDHIGAEEKRLCDIGKFLLNFLVRYGLALSVETEEEDEAETVERELSKNMLDTVRNHLTMIDANIDDVLVLNSEHKIAIENWRAKRLAKLAERAKCK